MVFFNKANCSHANLIRKFVCYFHFVSWTCISLGLHADIFLPNIEIHIPFGFIRFGYQWTSKELSENDSNNKTMICPLCKGTGRVPKPDTKNDLPVIL